jgi:hypothetical protein
MGVNQGKVGNKIMLTYELEIEYLAVSELGVHELYTEEEKDLWVKNMTADGFEQDKHFIIYRKIK